MLRAVVLNGSNFALLEQTDMKMIRIIIVISFWLCALMATANSETTDSVKSRNLDEVVVEAQLQRTSATVSTYLPTKRQKNAAADGNLVGHPAITRRRQNSNSSRVRVATFSISGTRRLKWADDM